MGKSTDRDGCFMLGNKAVSPVVVGVAEKGGASKRRPFFTSPDEVYEEYYEEQLPEKKRRLTSEQVIRFFTANSYPQAYL